MAQEIDLNEKDVKELEAAQAKDVRDSQVAAPPQEQKVEINLMTSVIVSPAIKFISDIRLVDAKDKVHPLYDMTVCNDRVNLTFRASAQKLRGLKVNLLQAMQNNRIYICDVKQVMEDPENDVLLWYEKV